MIAILTKSFRWAWLTCLLFLAGFLLNSISSYLTTRSNMRKTIAESTLPLTSDNVYSEIQRDLLQPVFIASLMAQDTFLRDWVLAGEKDEASITRYLHEIKLKYGTVSSFFVSEHTHKYYHAYGLLKTVQADEPRDAWYFRVRNLTEPYEINVDPDLANSDEMTIFINYRTFDYAGNFIGATGVGLTVRSVNNLISRYEAKFDRQIYFTDRSGKMVLRPNNSPLLKYDSLQSIDGLEAYADELLTNKRTKLSYKRDGQTRMLNCRYVPELDWYLIVEQSESGMLAPIKQQLFINFAIGSLITLLAAGICFSMIGKEQSKLEHQNEALQQINQQHEAEKKAHAQATLELEKANQKLIKLNKEKDEFIGIVAHDLRNPLSGIIGLCELAKTDDEPFDKAPFIEDVRDCGDRMLELTEQLLEVSHIESFHGAIEKKDVHWNLIVDDSVEHFSKQAALKKITIERDLEATEDLVTQSHQEWLQVCVNNLLSNAIKYTPPYGKVFIRTRIKDNQVEIEVKDTGPGISREDQAKMFGKFVRLSASPTGNESSTGLGLYIVKKMCERLGLDIKVNSELGFGTALILIQPLEAPKSGI